MRGDRRRKRNREAVPFLRQSILSKKVSATQRRFSYKEKKRRTGGKVGEEKKI